MSVERAGEKRRKTIPLVEPRYCDAIVCAHNTIGREELIHALARLSERQVKDSFAATYLYFLVDLTHLYTLQNDVLVRNRRGSFIADLRVFNERRHAWLQVVSRDEVFSRFFLFTGQLRSKQEIVQEFNAPSGRYLIRWGRWLGKTLYIPRHEAYRSFHEATVRFMDDFWEQLQSAYKILARQSWSGVERASMMVGEVREQVCTSCSILPLTFDCNLSLLYQSRKHYTQLELIGLPPHRLKERTEQSKLDPIIIDGVKYFYISVHTE